MNVLLIALGIWGVLAVSATVACAALLQGAEYGKRRTTDGRPVAACLPHPRRPAERAPDIR